MAIIETSNITKMSRAELLTYEVVNDRPYRQIDVEPDEMSLLLEDNPGHQYSKKESYQLDSHTSSKKSRATGSGYKISGTLLILVGLLSPALVFILHFAPVFLFIPILLTAFGAGLFYKGELKNKVDKTKKENR